MLTGINPCLSGTEAKDPVMSALGKLGKGKRKALSQEERWRRAKRLAAVRGRRWPVTGQDLQGRPLARGGLLAAEASEGSCGAGQGCSVCGQ